MANSQAMTTAFKRDVLCGTHAFGTQGANAVRTVTTKDDFFIALFLVTASRGASDTVYNTTGELAGTGNYTQGGKILASATPPSTTGTTGWFNPSANVTWTALTSSGAFDAAVVYNNTATNKEEVSVHTFSSQSITAADFTLTMPTSGVTSLIRIA